MKLPVRFFFWIIIAALVGGAVEYQKSIIRESRQAEVVSILNELQANGWPIEVWKVEKSQFTPYESVSLSKANQTNEGLIHLTRQQQRKIQTGATLLLPRTHKVVGTVKKVPPRNNPIHGLWEVEVLIHQTQLELFEDTDFRSVWVQTAQPTQTLAIPTEAIIFEQNTPYVWLFNEDAPEKRKIKVGHSNYWATEVLSGLSEGDKLITNGMVDIQRRPKVRIKSRLRTEDIFHLASQQ